jgi:hypothetical protein
VRGSVRPAPGRTCEPAGAPPLPAQIREAKSRRQKLLEAEKEWIASGSAKLTAAQTIQGLRDAQAIPESDLKRLEANLDGKQPGVCAAPLPESRLLSSDCSPRSLPLC